jgi:hypothetical protein
MPHVHGMSIFDVDRIEIRFDPHCRCYEIRLCEGYKETTVINVWRNSQAGDAPELIVKDNPAKAILESAS